MSIATEPVRYMDALKAGIADAMEADERVVLIGIDVGAGGGIFTVTKGLHERFGSDRVLDTPISEMGFVGAAVGAAMTGLRPIVEIMFMDFIGVCLDPILNQAAKLPYMTAGALQCPIVFRTQTGAGRSAGAQHSQSLETMFAHIPGLKVVMPATVTDAHVLLVAAVEDPNPVVFVESRRLYAMKGQAGEDPLPIGKARVALVGTDVTVVTWGQMLRESLKAAEESSASIEVIDLRSLVPLDMETVLASAERTGRLLVVHEAVQDFGAGAEIAARAGEELYDVLRVPVQRIGAPSVPMPFNPDLERALMPSAPAIVAAAERMVSEG
jgi:pyruvate/2-oxoglutarate/acetoin dehydrogenase E1 component